MCALRAVRRQIQNGILKERRSIICYIATTSFPYTVRLNLFLRRLFEITGLGGQGEITTLSYSLCVTRTYIGNFVHVDTLPHSLQCTGIYMYGQLDMTKALEFEVRSCTRCPLWRVMFWRRAASWVLGVLCFIGAVFLCTILHFVACIGVFMTPKV